MQNYSYIEQLTDLSHDWNINFRSKSHNYLISLLKQKILNYLDLIDKPFAASITFCDNSHNNRSKLRWLQINIAHAPWTVILRIIQVEKLSDHDASRLYALIDVRMYDANAN